MMQRSFAVLALVAGCLQSHQGVQPLAKNDCYQCHRLDYEGTPAVAVADPAVPDHLAHAATYTTQCADCHITSTWYSHPDLLFPVQAGTHANITCNSCHLDSTDNAGDAHGANTQCTSCHPATEVVYDDTITRLHTNVPQFAYSSPSFCLSCHPTGAAKHHDDAIWPQTHHARSCSSCHNRSLGPDTGGMNAPCTKCHQGAHHQDRGDPTGCVAQGCHRGGRGGD